MFFQVTPSDKQALVSTEDVMTYKDLYDDIKMLGEYIEPRKMAINLCENSPSSVVGYLSFLNKKTVPLMIDKKMDRALLNNILDIYKPDYMFSPKEAAPEFTDYEVLCDYKHYALLGRKVKEPVELYPELGLLLTTSGSTGSPKLVRQTYKNIQSNAEVIVKFLNIDSSEKPITTLPMNYTYGLSIINSHLQAGATILMTDQPMNMKPFWTFLKENGATSFGGVPFTYEMLKKVRFFKMDIPSLKYMTQSGGKLDPELHKEFAEWCAEHGKKFIAMYGQTEATARMAFLPSERSIEKYGSIGVAVPGGKFILVDVNGEEITTPNVVGELVYEGENVTLGYAESREDLAKGDERHGRLETGDMARIDEEGFIFIAGRKKRFLKIFGNRVGLDEIDILVKRNFSGVDCVSAGVDDHMKTYVTSEAIVDDVRKFLSNTTHLSESAFEVLYIPEIPRSEVGKVLYSKIPN